MPFRTARPASLRALSPGQVRAGRLGSVTPSFSSRSVGEQSIVQFDGRMNSSNLLSSVACCALLTFTGCNQASQTNAPAGTSSTPVTPAASPLTGFARDLQFVRSGRYTYIFVFARKDGKPIDREDSAFLRTNAPQVVDWVATEEGKKVIGGTNFNLEEGNMAQLKRRFVVDDYSAK